MQRIPEPELMESQEQGQAYAQADFSGPNTLFLQLFADHFPGFSGQGTVLDLGCGPADILIRFSRAYPGCTCIGVDGAEAMLAPGRQAVAAAQLGHRITLQQQLLPCPTIPGLQEKCSAVLSNSLLHHLHQPEVLWQTVQDQIAPNGAVLVMDLFRPASPEAAQQLVHTYTANEPAVLQQDFYNSLLAAFRPEEIQEQLHRAGLSLHCEQVSDRHLAVWGWCA